MSRPSQPSPFPFSRGPLSGVLPAWIVLAFGLFCTLVGWQYANERAHDAADQRFNLKAEQLESAIRARMLSYEALLSGGVGLFEAVGEVDRQQWRTYVNTLEVESRFPGILGIGYTERIPPNALEAHQRAVRAEGFPGYVVTPVGKRDEYHSIVYLEPFTGRNLRAFGYDMYSEPVRRAAMSRARDTGLPTLTGKVTLVQETERDTQAGVLLYVPVYHGGMPIATVTQRQAALKGFVYAPFRMNDLMQGIIGDQFPDLGLEIYAGSERRPAVLLYDSHADHAALDSEHTPMFSQVHPFEANNTIWTLHITSRPAFEATLQPQRQAGILLAGLLISLLLFGITWSLASLQLRAKALAKEMTRALRGSEERFRAVHDHAAFGIVQTTPDGKIVHANPAFQRMLGYDEDELVGAHWAQFTAHEDHAENQRYRQEMLSGQRDSYHMEKRYVCKDGRTFWGNLAVTAVRKEDGTLEFQVALVEDITARKQQEEAMAHQAYHDALTGLPNRTLFFDRLDQALAKAQRAESPMALMFLDLDHFKSVNDSLGHAAGDDLLKEVARRLKATLRSSDTVARIGGDEFTVLLPVVDGEHGALQVARKILQSLPVTLMIDGQPLTVTPSIGISLYPDHAKDAETLVIQADKAMYASKQTGRNRFTLYNPTLSEGKSPVLR